MPIVSAYGPRKVSADPLPAVRKTAHETDLSTGVGLDEAKGRAAETIGNAQAGFTRTLGDVAFGATKQILAQHEAARKQETEAKLWGLDRQLGEFDLLEVRHPDSAFAKAEGPAAIGMVDAVTTKFDELAAKLETSLTTDEERQAFYRLRDRRRERVREALVAGSAQKVDAYGKKEREASLTLSQRTAIANADNPNVIAEELNRQRALVARWPGLGPDARTEMSNTAVSATLEGVITSYLDRGFNGRAKQFFEDVQDQILAEKRAPLQEHIDKSFKEGRTRGEAQDATRTILAAGGTLTEQRARAKEIADPDIQDAVLQRLEHEATIKAQTEKDDEKGRLQSAYDVLDQTHNVNAIPPTMWVRLSGAERSSLRTYAEHLVKGVPIETDLPTYYGLMQQAAAAPQEFASVNLLKYRSKLDQTEFKQLAGLQLSIANGDRTKVDKELTGFRTANQIVEDSLAQYGIDPKAKDTTPEGKAIAQFRRMLDQRVQAFGDLTGKKPTNEDIQRTADGLLSQSVKVPGSWWNLWPGGKSVSDTTKRLIDLTIDDVPDTDRAQIMKALQRAGRPVSDATVLDLYIETKSRTGR